MLLHEQWKLIQNGATPEDMMRNIHEEALEEISNREEVDAIKITSDIKTK